MWYQYIFTPAGRAASPRNAARSPGLLWKMWSPTWAFDDATFERTASPSTTPIFVVVSILHPTGTSAMSPAIRAMRRWKPSSRRCLLSMCRPSCCTAPADGVIPCQGVGIHGKHFTAHYERRCSRRRPQPAAGIAAAFADAAACSVCRRAEAKACIAEKARIPMFDANEFPLQIMLLPRPNPDAAHAARTGRAGEHDAGQRQQSRDPASATMPVMIVADASTMAIWNAPEASSKLWYFAVARSRSSSACLARSASCSEPSPVSGSER